MLSSGAVSGVFTSRFAPLANLEAIAQRAQLPPEVGDWIGREMTVTAQELNAAGAASIVRRVYTDRQSGTTIGMTLICGRAGPVSKHTPEVCYPNSGFEAVSQPARITINGENSDRFWVQRFRKPGVGQGFVSVVYGWNTGGKWVSPDNPRFAFGRLPVLFKLYAVSESPNDESLEKENPCVALLRALLPQLNQSLTPIAVSGESSR